jgi:hypothetical protein
VSEPAHHHTGFEPEINGPAIKVSYLCRGKCEASAGMETARNRMAHGQSRRPKVLPLHSTHEEEAGLNGRSENTCLPYGLELDPLNVPSSGLASL